LNCEKWILSMYRGRWQAQGYQCHDTPCDWRRRPHAQLYVSFCLELVRVHRVCMRSCNRDIETSREPQVDHASHELER